MMITAFGAEKDFRKGKTKNKKKKSKTQTESRFRCVCLEKQHNKIVSVGLSFFFSDEFGRNECINLSGGNHCINLGPTINEIFI